MNAAPGVFRVSAGCMRAVKNELLKGTGLKFSSGAEVFGVLFLQAFRQVADDGLINKSTGEVLCLTFARLHVIDSQELNRALASLQRIKRLKYSASFCAQLEVWSTFFRTPTLRHSLAILRT